MKDKEYIENALRTESMDFEAIRGRFEDEKTIRAIHASFGLVTEAGEFADVFKKHLFYGKPIDWVNLEEEMGDLFWYLAIFADVLGKDKFDSIMDKNIAKLAKRYANQKFTDTQALGRDLEAERKILESEDEEKTEIRNCAVLR